MTASTESELLTDADVAYLSAKAYSYTATKVDGWVHVVIRDYALPDAYVPNRCELLIRLPAGYPHANPDMFWTRPDVRLKNGGCPSKADVHETYGGESWQRWSRHIPSDRWRPGLDNLQTFLTTIRRELQKGI